MTTQLEISGKAIYWRLFGYTKKYWYVFLLAIAANLLYAYVDTQFIKAIQPLVDEGLVGDNKEILRFAPYFVILMVTLRSIAGFVSVYCMAWSGRYIVKALRQECFEQLALLPANYYDKHSSGEIIAKLTYNTERLAQVTTDALTQVVRQGGSVVIALYLMMAINWKLTLVFLVSAPIIGIIVAFATKHFRRVAKKIQNAMGNVTQVTAELIEGQEVIKTFGAQVYESQRFEKVNEYNRQQTMKFALTKAISVPLVQLVAVFGFAFVLHISTSMIESGELSAGDFVALLGFMLFIFKPIKQLTTVNSTIQEGITAAHGVFEVIDEPTEINQGTKKLKTINGQLRFDNIRFRYPEAFEDTIFSMNLAIPAGQTLALVGRSGSGKSTLTHLLLRFYEPTQGKIFIDDIDIHTVELHNWRSHIAFVSQHVVLFNDTVRNNIAYAVGDVDEQKVIEAAKRAHAWEFIEKLDDGLDTLIGENGGLLSGGQKQRIAIARAFYKNAPILILDEATSALDSESERAVQAALDDLMRNKTTLVIAHRLSTIEKADTIAVIESGRILEQGNHETLLRTGGAYANLYQLQVSSHLSNENAKQ